ncbi:MAG: tetratricopeptide repeat protein, partial [Candidatus Eisenbacteria bacterium]
MRTTNVRRAGRRGGGARPSCFLGTGVAALLVLCGLLALLPGSSRAQQATNDDARFDRKLQEADRNLYGGNAERALRLFEELLSSRPESKEALIGLVSSRIQLRRLDGLETLAEERLRMDPGDPDLTLLLGEVRAAAGSREEALAAWRSAVPLFDEPDKGYREAARRMETGRMFEEAIALLDEGRLSLGDPFLFAEELCRLHSLTGNGDASAAEWVRAAAGGTRKAAEALREIRELKESGEIEEYPYGLLRAVLDSIPSASGVREILADLFLADGRCAEALREFRELDRSLPHCGRFLLSFARGAVEIGCADEAANAAREVARACDEAGTRLEASFLLGRVERIAGNPERAAETYRSIIEGTRNPKERETARLEL